MSTREHLKPKNISKRMEKDITHAQARICVYMCVCTHVCDIYIYIDACLCHTK